MPAPSSKRPWWRRLRVHLSVRTLLAVVFLIAVGLGWTVHRAHVQRDTVAMIERGGGHVVYDGELSPGRFNDPGLWDTQPPSARSRVWLPWPHWLRDAVELDVLDTVRRVSLGPENRAATLAQVARLGGLEQVIAKGDAALSDAEVAHLAGLTQLRALCLDGPVPGESLAHLAALTQLKTLWMGIKTDANPSAGADLSPLRGMTDRSARERIGLRFPRSRFGLITPELPGTQTK